MEDKLQSLDTATLLEMKEQVVSKYKETKEREYSMLHIAVTKELIKRGEIKLDD